MQNPTLLRLAGPPLSVSERAWVAIVGVALAAIVGAGVAATNDDDPALLIIGLIFGAPVGGLLLTIRHRNLLIGAVLLTGALFPYSAAEYHAAGTSSTAGLVFLWVPYGGIPLALAFALVDRFLIGDERREPPQPTTKT